MEKEYPNGNTEILNMINNHSFDANLAESILEETDLNAPISNLQGYPSTYLCEAVNANNFPAVSFLLEHGANPNLDEPDSALWNLQYLWGSEDWKTRYEIAKLFFQYGADPNYLENGEIETLYDWVLFKVYNDPPEDDNEWENLKQFYKLLVIYGGGHGGIYPPPVFLENIDKNRLDDYDVCLYWIEEGVSLGGRLLDGEKIVAEL